MMLIIALVPMIAVNIEDKMPITNVTAKPFTTPVPMVNSAIAAVSYTHLTLPTNREV